MAARDGRRTTSGPEALGAPGAPGALKALLLVGGLAGLTLWGTSWAAGGEQPRSAHDAALAVAPRVASPVEQEPAAVPRAPARASAHDPELEQTLRSVVERWVQQAAKLSEGLVTRENTTVAVCVREAGGGELAALDADRPLRPASNLKLVTTAAALVLLGPAWNFETGFELRGPDLIVRGAGDPFFDPELRGRSEALLDPVAEALVARGIRRIEGELVLDPGSFADPAPGPAWPSADQHWDDYCALVAGLTINGGILVTEVTPARGTGPARLEVHPAPHGLKERYGVTTEPGAKLDVRVGATAAGVTVKGVIPSGIETWTGDFAHPDPHALFAAVLRDRLRRAGVEAIGGWRVERGAAAGEPLTLLRTPVLDVLAPINTHSVNSVADALFLATGRALFGEATPAAGRRATARALARLGISGDGLVQVDGSGLSRENRVTARQLAALVDDVSSLDYDTAAAWLQSLPLAGETGTLAERMIGTSAQGRVAAKTGWIRGASSLSGVADALDGRRTCFSIIVEYPARAGGLNTRCWKPMMDELCVTLVEWAP